MIDSLIKLVDSIKAIDSNLAIIFVVGLGFLVLLLTLVK